MNSIKRLERMLVRGMISTDEYLEAIKDATFNEIVDKIEQLDNLLEKEAYKESPCFATRIRKLFGKD